MTKRVRPAPKKKKGAIPIKEVRRAVKKVFKG